MCRTFVTGDYQPVQQVFYALSSFRQLMSKKKVAQEIFSNNVIVNEKYVMLSSVLVV